MTLQEAKNITAKENGWDNWNHILFSDGLSQEAKYILFDMACEKYARSKFDEAIEEMRCIVEIHSDCELPKFDD